MLKKLLLILASVFLIWQSFKLIAIISEVQVESWLPSIICAVLLNLFITGIFAFSGFALPTQKLMPEIYYKIKNVNQLKKTFSLFGVELFRKFLLATVWKDKAQRNKYFNGKQEGIDNLITQTQKAEFGHLFPFAILTVISLYYLGSNIFKDIIG